MSLTLVIMAAGIGSRFGGLKQITPICKTRESIIDFSIHDALKSGFERFIIVVRPEIEKDFHDFFGKRLEKYVDLIYAHQEIDNDILPERRKPFGTAHAVLSAGKLINGPFSVINADDFYGLESFQKAADFLNSDLSPDEHAVIVYKLKSTLSKYGTVSRAKCEVDERINLTGISELLKVFEHDMTLYYNQDGLDYSIPEDTYVSMNFWCFQPDIMFQFQSVYRQFLKDLPQNPDSEILIPDVVNNSIKNKQGIFKVLPTDSPWFGITYKEDFEMASAGIKSLIKSGSYSVPLWK